MPIYEYNCQDHGRFELLRTFDEFEDPGACGKCGAECERVVSIPGVATGDFGTPKRAAYKMERYVDRRLSGQDKGGDLQEAIRRTGHKPKTDDPAALGLKNVRDTYN